MRSSLAIIASVLMLPSMVLAAPMDLDQFTDFEGIDTDTGEVFSIGASPETAEFSGDSFAGVAGIQELYFSGLSAWMVNPSGTGIIDFETNAAEVQFWARTRSTANGSTEITAFDDSDQVISSVTLNPPNDFELVTFMGGIDRIEVVNNATGFNQMNAIDDFGFSPVMPPVLSGDMDLDDDIDFDDIDDFVLGLNDPSAYEAMFGVPPALHGDTDNDGDHDFDDIPGFVNLLTGGGRVDAVPEPSAVVLLVTGAVGLMALAMGRCHGWQPRKKGLTPDRAR